MNDGTRTISITSGKGGVGKTTLTCNIAFELGRQGHRVLILDGDLGMANVDILFGMRASMNISHVLDGRCELQDIIVEVAPNVHLIPADAAVEAALKRLRVGQVIELKGVLVEARREDGWYWRSSLSRSDSGNGACELLLVHEARAVR